MDLSVYSASLSEIVSFPRAVTTVTTLVFALCSWLLPIRWYVVTICKE